MANFASVHARAPPGHSGTLPIALIRRPLHSLDLNLDRTQSVVVINRVKVFVQSSDLRQESWTQHVETGLASVWAVVQARVDEVPSKHPHKYLSQAFSATFKVRFFILTLGFTCGSSIAIESGIDRHLHSDTFVFTC